MHVAVQGCCHGSLTAIYDTLGEYERRKGVKVDLLLLCGDFQALRNTHDFDSLAVPPKYHALGTFYQYYSGERVAPVLTLVIGGNHEASNYMWELYHGGWLAPNIYYLGAAGSVFVNGLRIVGASGIYKPHDYHKGHFETVPYNKSTLRSAYHIREYDVAKLMHLSRTTPSVFLSHDWPIGIARHGNTKQLLQRKPFFRSEVEKNTLGSPPLFALLNKLQPEYWFAAHLHVKFAALYEHREGAPTALPEPPSDRPSEAPSASEPPPDARRESATSIGHAPNPDEIAISEDEFMDVPASTGNPDEIAISEDEGNPDEITISEDEEVVGDVEVPVPQPAEEEVVDERIQSKPPSDTHPEPSSVPEAPRATRFLALDKCGPGKDFIQFLDLPTPLKASPPKLTYDPEWLAITRALHPYLSLDVYASLPPQEERDALVADELVRIRDEGVLVPAELEEDALLAEMEAEFEAELAAEVRRQSNAEEGVAENGDERGKENGGEEAEPAAENGAATTQPDPSEAARDETDFERMAPLVWEDAGAIDIGRVQQFWPTAPPHPGGEPRQWYTNPQTEAFCGMLGIQNKVNPRPVER